MKLTKLLLRVAPWGLAAFQGWLFHRLLKRYGQVLLAQERLEAQSSEATVAGGPSLADQLRASEYQLYHRLQDDAIRSVPPYPVGRFTEAGIVMLAGGPLYYSNAWVALTMLRSVLGCRLPIQVWYLGPHEMSPRMIELLRRFDVQCVDALAVQPRRPGHARRGWETKPFAILYSPFKDVILLDADNVPLIDPAVLLSAAEYHANGAIFWPDLYNLGREHPLWEICRVTYRDEPEFETGQIVVDKERCWRALHLTLHLNELSDFYYRHTHGDKETFHMAWRMLSQPYSMPQARPLWVSDLVSPGDTYRAGVLQQHDFDARIVFQHRTGAKWAAWGRNLHVPGFEHEAVCLAALEQLRREWDGRVDLAHSIASAPAMEAELLQWRYYLYRRIGADERVLSLLPGQQVGGGGRLEQTWHLEHEQGQQTLVIEGRDGPTCRLHRERDGVWRGMWIQYERMPVELVPLGAAGSTHQMSVT